MARLATDPKPHATSLALRAALSEYSSILAHVPPALLVVFRIGGLAIYGPVFGATVIPARVKVFFAVVVGIAVYPLLSTQMHVGPTALRLELWALVPLLTAELLIGLVILALRVPTSSSFVSRYWSSSEVLASSCVLKS